MKLRNLLIASTSTVYGTTYLEYLRDEIAVLYEGVKKITFVPYARPGGISHNHYTKNVKGFFNKMGIRVKGVHKGENAQNNILEAEGIFIGGGNTFVLLKQLYEQHLIDGVRSKIASGVPYLGTSAGSNILGQTICTTNDMPIVYPPSFKALEVVDFNINPHYVDPEPNSKHMGETRETRIKEFLVFNSIPVVGLREGSFLRINQSSIKLGGELPMRLFQKGAEPREINPNQDLSFLINDESQLYYNNL